MNSDLIKPRRIQTGDKLYIYFNSDLIKPMGIHRGDKSYTCEQWFIKSYENRQGTNSNRGQIIYILTVI